MKRGRHSQRGASNAAREGRTYYLKEPNSKKEPWPSSRSYQSQQKGKENKVSHSQPGRLNPAKSVL